MEPASNPLSTEDFNALYGTEEQCFNALLRWRWPHGFECPNCRHPRYCRVTPRQLFQCNRCRRQHSVTARTPLRSIKFPLTVLFRGIHFLETTEDRRGLVAEMSRVLGLSYNSTRRLKRKLDRVMNDPVRPLVLSGPTGDRMDSGARGDNLRAAAGVGQTAPHR